MSEYSLVWHNLRCEVQNSTIAYLTEKYWHGNKDVQRKKQIFTGLCGEFKSGELIAVMGPSGAGKSKFLECISGRRKNGVHGFIGVTCERKVKRIFVPQQDIFFSSLSVKESLTFALKLNGHNISKRDTRPEAEVDVNCVETLLKKFMLENCADVRICNVSGGQARRLSIAQEMVTKPDILMLDEPTTGLDSKCCFEIVDYLASLIQRQPSLTLIVTIHQPSLKILNLFNRVYVLTRTGECIYNDAPSSLLPTLFKFNLLVPKYCNPADFITEVANGEHGNEDVKSMVSHFKAQYDAQRKNRKFKNIKESASEVGSNNYSKRIAILTQRCVMIQFRDPLFFFLRLMIHIAVPLFVAAGFYGCGESSGCLPKLNVTDLDDFAKSRADYDFHGNDVYSNVATIVAILAFGLTAGSVTNSVTFPMTMKIIRKEMFNGWYSSFAYFAGSTIADIPFQILNSTLCSISFYFLSSQPMEVNRFLVFLLVSNLLGLSCQIHGIIFGIILFENITTALLMSVAACFPILIFNRLFIKPASETAVLKVACMLNYGKFAIDGIFIALFGNNRCNHLTIDSIETEKTKMKLLINTVFNSTEHSTQYVNNYNESNTTAIFSEALFSSVFDGIEYDKNGFVVSTVMSTLKLSDDDLITSIIAVISYYILLRIIAYLLFRCRANGSE